MTGSKILGHRRTIRSDIIAEFRKELIRRTPLLKTFIERHKIFGLEAQIRTMHVCTPEKMPHAAGGVMRRKLPPLSDPIWESSNHMRALKKLKLVLNARARELRRDKVRIRRYRKLAAKLADQGQDISSEDLRRAADETVKIVARWRDSPSSLDELTKLLSRVAESYDSGGD